VGKHVNGGTVRRGTYVDQQRRIRYDEEELGG
jgi:hypothetical protein